MRKLAFCLCKNKDSNQLRGDREADQRLCFRYTDSAIPLLFYFLKLVAIFCGCTAQFVSEVVGISEDRFSHDVALMTSSCCNLQIKFLQLLCEL